MNASEFLAVLTVIALLCLVLRWLGFRADFVAMVAGYALFRAIAAARSASAVAKVKGEA
jgi:hypothetical protein